MCSIHAHAGEKALSHTCKTYPKATNFIGGTKYESLDISCPEAARIILFEPEAFKFEALNSDNKSTVKLAPT